MSENNASKSEARIQLSLVLGVVCVIALAVGGMQLGERDSISGAIVVGCALISLAILCRH